MNIPSSFFLINQENPKKEEEDLKILNNINHLKRTKSIFQNENYEKFKPKPKIESGKIDSAIYTAENKVKLLLSSFLHDLKTEQKKEEYTNSNLNSQFKRKKTKIFNKKSSIKKKSSNNISIDTSIHKLKKIKTISEDKSHKNESKNNVNQSPIIFHKRKTSPKPISIYLNYQQNIKGSLPNLKKIYPKNLDSFNTNNFLLDNNIENFGKTKKKNSIDFDSHNKENTSMSDLGKGYSRYKSSSPRKLKKYKKAKTKPKINNKKSFKPNMYSSLNSQSDLNDIINEKLSKLSGNVREGIVTDEILKEPKEIQFVTNNNNLKYCYSYVNSNSNDSNINCYSNSSDKAKSETGSPKKKFNFNDINKKGKIENINEVRLKRNISNENETFSGRIQRAKSNLFTRLVPVTSITKKKYVKFNPFKDLKNQFKNSIILRPEDINLSDGSDIKNSISKVISIDGEISSTSKINISIDHKNTESNLSNINQNIEKLNKNKFGYDDEAINNKNKIKIWKILQTMKIKTKIKIKILSVHFEKLKQK